MKFRFHLLAGFCVCLFALATVIPVAGQYRFVSWTTDNGMPQNSVNDIRQTRDGYIWLSTFDGLVRFDGVRFTVFDKSRTQGLSSNRFLRMFEDGQGDLWIGTEDGGIVRYHHGRFTSYGKEQGVPGLNGVYVTDDADGHAVAYLAGAGIVRFIDGKFQPFNPTSKLLEPHPAIPRESRRISCSIADEKIDCLNYGSWGKADGLPSLNRVGGDAIDDGRGALWIALTDAGLVKIENGKVVRVFTERDGLPGTPVVLVTGAHASLVSKDKSGAFWLTDVDTMRSQFIGTDVAKGLTEEGNVLGYEDREGNLWFGTNRAGLLRARRQFITNYSTANGLTENNIYPIYQDRQGVVWVGTTKGLFRFTDGKFALDDSVGYRIITSIAEDQQGRLIVGTYDEPWLGEGGHLNPLPMNRIGPIWTVYAEPGGAIWFGCDQGLLRLKDGVETLYKTADGLSGNAVKTIVDDGAGGLWIGTFGGLTHYTNGKFTSWTESDGLPSRNVRALHRDSDGTLWIGTYDGGMARYKDGKFTNYTVHEGLFDNGVFQILEDARDNFWISCNHGIYRVNRRELNEFAQGKRASINSVGYGKGDGMLNVECNGGRWPAGIKTRDGRLLFPTQDGVAVIDPDGVPINQQPPPVFVESLLVDNSAVDIDSEVQIRPDQENFEIRYTALSYINSENIRFKYELDGLDHDWIDAGTRRTAYYSHLQPGKYTFRVIAANRDGVWNNEGALVHLNVRPRFYQTWLFKSLVALGIFGLAFSVFRVRADRLERARKAQEEFSIKLLASQEQERERIAAELHDSLGQSLLIIKNRIALAKSDIDEQETVEEQLDELAHSAAAAIDECREIAYNLRPYQISRFGLTKSLYGIFMRINEVSNIKAVAEIDEIDDALTKFGQVNIYRIVQEGVNNVIKHSQATNASLVVKRHGEEITLLIEDDGQGFTPPQPGANGADRGGFGLIGIAERVRMLQGKCEIESKPHEFTRIRIRIPTVN